MRKPGVTHTHSALLVPRGAEFKGQRLHFCFGWEFRAAAELKLLCNNYLSKVNLPRSGHVVRYLFVLSKAHLFCVNWVIDTNRNLTYDPKPFQQEIKHTFLEMYSLISTAVSKY